MKYLGKMLLVLVLIIQVPTWEFAILLNHVCYRKMLIVPLQVVNCHLAYLAASKGGAPYHKKTGFDIEEHQVHLCYFFKKSTRRKGILANYTEFVGGEKWEEITRYVSTGWLPLEQCCGYETKRFEALKSVFLPEDEKDSTKRFKRLSNDFADPLTEVLVAFFTAALPIFTNYN